MSDETSKTMAKLPGARTSPYSDDDIRRAAASYLIHGKASLVARETQIPERTLAEWIGGKHGTERWDHALAEVRAEQSARIRARTATIVESALDRVQTKIDEGDGSIKDLAWIGAVYTDKLRVQDGQATTLTASVDLNKLADQFASAGNQYKASKSVTYDNDEGEPT